MHGVYVHVLTVYSPIRLEVNLDYATDELFTLFFETESLVDSDLTQYAGL